MIKVNKKALMDKSIDIFANIVLSFNGEDIFIDAEKDTITMSSTFRSGLKTLISMDEHHRLFQKVAEINEIFSNLGLTLYTRTGIFKVALFGLNAGRGWLKTLFFIARTGRKIGIV
jgi:hypothetical protein